MASKHAKSLTEGGRGGFQALEVGVEGGRGDCVEFASLKVRTCMDIGQELRVRLRVGISRSVK